MYRGRNIITVSDAVGEDLVKVMGIVPRELITIYNPFDVAQIRQRAQEENPFAGEEYILHVGRFHRVKRQDRLLEAFAQSGIPARLVIVGQGEAAATAELQAKIAELNLQQQVVLAGFARNPLPMIKGARLFALSSDSEGLPGVLIESLICGTPIVSTACPGGVGEIMVGELAAYQADLSATSLAEKLRLGWQAPPTITAAMYAKFEINLIIDRYLKLAVE